MYKSHFNFKEAPFGLTPNTQFFFNKSSHRNALNTLLVSLRHAEGFIKIVGEVGTGKTIVCRKLLSSLGDNFITAYIPNPYLTPDELKYFVAEELDIQSASDMPSYKLLGVIYRRLIQLARQGKQVVLVIDEAQAMPRETVESLRLLTNLETEKRKLLHVVLLGQPELDKLLARPDLRQLKQRIIYSETIHPLSRIGALAYLKRRVRAAGSDQKVFTNSAALLIAIASGGIPRLINILAHKSLLAAYGMGKGSVTISAVARAIRDTGESRKLGKLLAVNPHVLWPLLGVILFLPLWLTSPGRGMLQ
ncbi:ExeA family protein [Aurantivibrio plasticivorans]